MRRRARLSAIMVVLVLVAAFSSAGLAAKKLLVFHYPRDFEIERVKAVIGYFNKKYPDVEVETYYGWLGKMDVAIAGGMVPDVIYSDPSTIPTLIAKSYLAPLDSFVQSDRKFSLEAFLPATLDMVRWQGRLVGIPFTLSLKGLLYNKDLFDQAGLSYPTDDWTWDSYISYGKKMVRDTDGNYQMDQYGMDMRWGSHSYWPAWIYQSGAGFWNREYTKSTVATPKFVRAIQFASDLVNVHRIAPRVAGAKILEQDLSGIESGQVFRNRRAGMTWGSNELIGQNPFEADLRVGLARMPMGPESRASLINGDFVGIYRFSKEPQLAWEFVKASLPVSRERHLTGKEVLVPVDLETMQKKFALPQFKSAPPDVFYQLALDARPEKVRHPASSAVYDWGWNVLDTKMLTGTSVPVKPMLEDLQRMANAELNDALARGSEPGW